MDTTTGEEIPKKDSIGSYDAFRELQQPSSIELMRNSILQSILRSPAKVLEPKGKYGLREEFPNPSQPSIEVKFLKKRCSSFGDPQKSAFEEGDAKRVKDPSHISMAPAVESTDINRSSSPNLASLVESGSFEASGDFFMEKTGESSEKLNVIAESTSTIPELQNASKNNLKLACRSLSNGIFEDCSTYNITFPDSSPEIKNSFNKNDFSTNSVVDSYSETSSTDPETYSVESAESELLFSNSLRRSDSLDDQTSLCDTFFSNVINGDYNPPSGNQSPRINPVNRKSLSAGGDLQKSGQIPKEGSMEEDRAAADVTHPQGGRRNSRRMRRRNRKSHSRNPLVYECPKCGVSYIISSNVPTDGACCLHCDLWTSVEPEFMKREKLTWNTCRIC